MQADSQPIHVSPARPAPRAGSLSIRTIAVSLLVDRVLAA